MGLVVHFKYFRFYRLSKQYLRVSLVYHFYNGNDMPIRVLHRDELRCRSMFVVVRCVTRSSASLNNGKANIIPRCYVCHNQCSDPHQRPVSTWPHALHTNASPSSLLSRPATYRDGSSCSSPVKAAPSRRQTHSDQLNLEPE